MKAKHQWAAIAEKYSGAECTLDGHRARVRGKLCDFAKVGQCPSGPEYDFAWPTVARVMENGGKFKS